LSFKKKKILMNKRVQLGGDPGKTRTRWRDYVSQPTRERLGSPGMSRNMLPVRGKSGSAGRFRCPRDPTRTKRMRMDGWMNKRVFRKCQKKYFHIGRKTKILRKCLNIRVLAQNTTSIIESCLHSVSFIILISQSHLLYIIWGDVSLNDYYGY